MRLVKRAAIAATLTSAMLSTNAALASTQLDVGTGRQLVSELFESIFGRTMRLPILRQIFQPCTGSACARSPITVTSDGYELKFRLPGFTEEDIQVAYKDHVLRVLAKKSEEYSQTRQADPEEFAENDFAEESAADTTIERTGSFKSVVRVEETIPGDAGSELTDVKTHFDDGVLTVTVAFKDRPQDEAPGIPVAEKITEE